MELNELILLVEDYDLELTYNGDISYPKKGDPFLVLWIRENRSGLRKTWRSPVVNFLRLTNLSPSPSVTANAFGCDGAFAVRRTRGFLDFGRRNEILVYTLPMESLQAASKKSESREKNTLLKETGQEQVSMNFIFNVVTQGLVQHLFTFCFAFVFSKYKIIPSAIFRICFDFCGMKMKKLCCS